MNAYAMVNAHATLSQWRVVRGKEPPFTWRGCASCKGLGYVRPSSIDAWPAWCPACGGIALEDVAPRLAESREQIERLMRCKVRTKTAVRLLDKILDLMRERTS